MKLTLQHKRDFVDVIRVKDPEMRVSDGSGGPNLKHKSLKAKNFL